MAEQDIVETSQGQDPLQREVLFPVLMATGEFYDYHRWCSGG